MPVNIKLNDNYRLTSDQHSYSLELLKVSGKDSKNPGEETWCGIAFFGDIKSALKVIPERIAMSQDIRTVKELLAEIRRYHNLIENVL